VIEMTGLQGTARALKVALAACGLLLPLALGACGSEESKMERGVAVDEEEAVPSSDKELEMTEEERKKQRERDGQ